MQDDSNQSFVSAAMTPGTSLSAEPGVASTPSSPLLSLLLANSASKPAPAEAAGSSPVKNVEQIAITSPTMVADDTREV